MAFTKVGPLRALFGDPRWGKTSRKPVVALQLKKRMYETNDICKVKIGMMADAWIITGSFFDHSPVGDF